MWQMRHSRGAGDAVTPADRIAALEAELAEARTWATREVHRLEEIRGQLQREVLAAEEALDDEKRAHARTQAELAKALHERAVMRQRLEKTQADAADHLVRLKDLSESFDRADGSLAHEFEIDNALERAREHLNNAALCRSCGQSKQNHIDRIGVARDCTYESDALDEAG